MNRDDIIMMAREAGIVWADHTVVGSRENLLEHFAKLIADRVTTELKQYYELTNGHIYDVIQAAVEAEREECAKIADEVGDDDEDCHAWIAADAIRARSEL
jgi:division protein CdvB (Snf7/Vps24/ESCRT-III family)